MRQKRKKINVKYRLEVKPPIFIEVRKALFHNLLKK